MIFIHFIKLFCTLGFVLIGIPAGNTIAEDRIWMDVNLEVKWSVDAAEFVFIPGRGFHIDDRHQIYLSDTGDNTIKIFDKEGSFVRAVGEAKGAGPGELLHPLGFSLDGQANIWVADPANARITVFSNDGSFIRHVSVNVLPYRIAVEEGGNFFYISKLNKSPEGLFAKISKEGELLKQFGTGIIENQVRNAMALSGEIAINKDGTMYYAPDFAGLVMGFNRDGEELFKESTVIPTPFPQVMFDERGGSWVDRNAERISRKIYADEEGRVVIFSTATPREGEKIHALDFYEQKTGQYLNSLRLPEYTYQARLKDDVLYTLEYTTEGITLFAWEVK